MINAMYLNYKKTNQIKITNPKINRPILGIQDLCRSINAIIKNKNKSGVYNLCSFNSTPEILGRKMRNILNCQLIVDMNPSFAYDFKISNQKFKKHFNFIFKDNIESIVNEIKSKYNQIEYIGVRKEYFDYVQKD
jgi:nucleoside-diphosphate-sugar epimerase